MAKFNAFDPEWLAQASEMDDEDESIPGVDAEVAETPAKAVKKARKAKAEAQPTPENEAIERLAGVLAQMEDADREYLVKLLSNNTDAPAPAKKAIKKASKKATAKKAPAKAEAKVKNTPALSRQRVSDAYILQSMPAKKDIVSARLQHVDGDTWDAIYFTRAADGKRNRFAEEVSAGDVDKVAIAMGKMFAHSSNKGDRINFW